MTKFKLSSQSQVNKHHENQINKAINPKLI